MISARIVSTFLLASTLGFSIQAQADAAERPYLGLDYSQRTYENSNTNASDTEIPAVRLRAGTELFPYLSIEAHIAVGTGDDTGIIGGTTPYTIESPLSYGVFVRPQVKLGPLALYALAGYSYVEFEYSTALVQGNPTDSAKDFSFGGGVQLDIGKNWALNADYVQYVEGFSAISGGAAYRF